MSKKIVLTRTFLEWRREWCEFTVPDDFDEAGDVEEQLAELYEKGEDPHEDCLDEEPETWVEADNWELSELYVTPSA